MWSASVYPFGGSETYDIGNVQAVSVASVPTNGIPTAVSFATPFQNACSGIAIMPAANINEGLTWNVSSVTKAGFILTCSGGDGSEVPFTGMALGN